MNRLIVLVLILLIDYIIYSNPNINKKVNAEFKTGTTAMALIEKDSMILAVDSRIGEVSSNGIAFTDTTNKIINIGSTFIICAGVREFGDVTVDDLVKENYNTRQSIANNCKNILEVWRNAFQSYLDSLSNTKETKFCKSI